MFERISINDQSALRKACETLDKGGIIVYPTDTIYGLGCDAFNDDAIQKLNLIIEGRVAGQQEFKLR